MIYNKIIKKIMNNEKLLKDDMHIININSNIINKTIINDLNDNFKLILLKKDHSLLQYIDNPSKEVQLAAVKQDGYAIEYIENPTTEVQLEAVKQNGFAIEYINNPSEEVQLEAIKNDREVIEYIDNPSFKVKIECINSTEYLIFIKEELAEANKKKDLSMFNDNIIKLLISIDYDFYKEFYKSERYKNIIKEYKI